MLQDALDECARWGELDVQGLLMLEGAKLEVQRGKMGDGMAMLKVLRANRDSRPCQWQLVFCTFIKACKLFSEAFILK